MTGGGRFLWNAVAERSGETALAGLARDINQSLDTRFRGYDGNSGVVAAAVQNGRRIA
jgi:hypothetical protein